MNIEQLTTANHDHSLKGVNFIESGSGPIVIEVEFKHEGELHKELMKTEDGHNITCKNIKEGYDLCLKAGIHSANLVQIIPHDEACQSSYADYHRDSIPLKF